MSAFTDKLARGKLVIASGHRTSKLHIIRLDQTKAENRGKDYKKDDGRDWWTGDALCGSEGGGYYWQPHEAKRVNISDDGRCGRCWASWRAQSQPAVSGWTADLDETEVDEWPLPTAWAELATNRHPLDVPDGGKPEDILDKAGEPVGIVRTEIRRWQRGSRIVRIVKLHDESARSSHAVTYWHADDKKEHCRYGTLAECRRTAHEIMAKGGY